MLYEIATLTVKLGTAAKAVAGIGDYVGAPEAKGTLLGCWANEIGELNQLLVLRSFGDHEAYRGERERALRTANPFNAGEAIAQMSFDTYVPFPFLPPVVPGKYGSVYEIRTYRLKHGGVPPTIAAWEAAMARARQAVAALDCDVCAGRAAALHPYLALREPRCPRRCARGIRRQGRVAAEGRAGLADRRDALDHRAADRHLSAGVRRSP
ncbi:NIPSNAP family protein [Bradyrhizobium diazoefficiens]|uniref:NIPSNAP family protein n=1 Tax=Bradyrhizobium diazoefficiens TaxID=1355477 RepID=UPI003599579D